MVFRNLCTNDVVAHERRIPCHNSDMWIDRIAQFFVFIATWHGSNKEINQHLTWNNSLELDAGGAVLHYANAEENGKETSSYFTIETNFCFRECWTVWTMSVVKYSPIRHGPIVNTERIRKRRFIGNLSESDIALDVDIFLFIEKTDKIWRKKSKSEMSSHWQTLMAVYGELDSIFIFLSNSRFFAQMSCNTGFIIFNKEEETIK